MNNLPDPTSRPSVIKRKASARQVRDAEQAKSDLLVSAIREFAVNGFANAGIEAIAEGAGLNKRMIYYYFGSKEDLYIAVLERVYTDIRRSEDTLGLEALSPIEAIRRLVEATWDYFVKTPELLAIVSLENTHRGAYIQKSEMLKTSTVRLVERLRAILDEGARTGVFRDDIEETQLMHCIAGLGFYYLNNRFTNSVIYNVDMMSPEALATRRRYMVEMILAFLRSKPGTDGEPMPG
ncbi:TetR family transcriptional regulator [Paracoccus thiocyanatus]|uniref:TetR family transcriptional regulator n=1 Tax=Paracoccus thiocyanatus TaxID=34006 RepID=A0A3D8PHM8_9RHOB|nr:TetR family transcriptional regulator [Paracoccus thiocyanatus]RDW14729.1 TetR family transcriptional regulator [Paracoccus thiocyanatus]